MEKSYQIKGKTKLRTALSVSVWNELWVIIIITHWVMHWLLGLSSRTEHTPGSQRLGDFVTRSLEERLRAARVNPSLFFEQASLCLNKMKYILLQKWLFCTQLQVWSLVFQSKAESLQQKEASLEPTSRLRSLRDRDTRTRFDQEVSIYLKCGWRTLGVIHEQNFIHIVLCYLNKRQMPLKNVM